MKTRSALALLAAAALTAGGARADEPFSPYGTAKADMRVMPAVDAVFDVNYGDPKDLRLLYGFIRSTVRQTRGKVVVVTHGPELRAFAKENYQRYQGSVDQLAELAKEEGVEFRMCGEAMRLAGFAAQDMHGYITIVPNGFAELAYWQSQGYRYLSPAPYSTLDVRYLEHPELKR